MIGRVNRKLNRSDDLIEFLPKRQVAVINTVTKPYDVSIAGSSDTGFYIKGNSGENFPFIARSKPDGELELTEYRKGDDESLQIQDLRVGFDDDGFPFRKSQIDLTRSSEGRWKGVNNRSYDSLTLDMGDDDVLNSFGRHPYLENINTSRDINNRNNMMRVRQNAPRTNTTVPADNYGRSDLRLQPVVEDPRTNRLVDFWNTPETGYNTSQLLNDIRPEARQEASYTPQGDNPVDVNVLQAMANKANQQRTPNTEQNALEAVSVAQRSLLGNVLTRRSDGYAGDQSIGTSNNRSAMPEPLSKFINPPSEQRVLQKLYSNHPHLLQNHNENTQWINGIPNWAVIGAGGVGAGGVGYMLTAKDNSEPQNPMYYGDYMV